jgi:hypothetical protein
MVPGWPCSAAEVTACVMVDAMGFQQDRRRTRCVADSRLVLTHQSASIPAHSICYMLAGHVSPRTVWLNTPQMPPIEHACVLFARRAADREMAS